jgi:protein-S-isoprenylcysteine O-methyltransferase Ste14
MDPLQRDGAKNPTGRDGAPDLAPRDGAPGPVPTNPSGFLERAGGVLFRWRSFTPVPIVLLAVPLIWLGRGPASPLWLVAGLALCAAGQALRAWVLGQVPDGTSGQNERLIATELNVSGPYAHTRNPLYLGNLGITLGLCLIAHSWALFLLVGALFGLQYRAIIAAEEGFLFSRFGAAYDDFRARVPRFWPALRARSVSTPRAWSWRRALKKEHNPMAAWALLALLFVALDHQRKAAYGYSAVVIGAVWLMVKAWKHQWLSGGFTKDLRRRLRETAR